MKQFSFKYFSSSLVVVSLLMSFQAAAMDKDADERKSAAAKPATTTPATAAAKQKLPLALETLNWEKASTAGAATTFAKGVTKAYTLTTDGGNGTHQFKAAIPVEGIKRVRVTFRGTVDVGGCYIGILYHKANDWLDLTEVAKPAAKPLPKLMIFANPGPILTTFEAVMMGSDPLSLVLGNKFGGGASKVTVDQIEMTDPDAPVATSGCTVM
jgi:hypothetical protein